MPAKMHSQYLRSFYSTMSSPAESSRSTGAKLDPKKVELDTYVVSAINDHIVAVGVGLQDRTDVHRSQPLRALAHRDTLPALSTPPSPKATYWTNGRTPRRRPGLAKTGRRWYKTRGGTIGPSGSALEAAPKVTPPSRLGNEHHPALEAGARQLRACSRLSNAPQTVLPNAPLRWVRGHLVNLRVQGHGEPLLLLNGLTRPLESWDPFIHALGDRTIVSFDAPGVGQSPSPSCPCR